MSPVVQVWFTGKEGEKGGPDGVNTRVDGVGSGPLLILGDSQSSDYPEETGPWTTDLSLLGPDRSTK